MFPRRKERFGAGVMIGEELHLGIFDSAAGPRRHSFLGCSSQTLAALTHLQHRKP